MIALKSQSPQISAAARLIFINWAASLQLWLVLEGVQITIGYIFIDLVTAAIYFRMSRRRWFPVPLCFLHGVLVIYHTGTFFNNGEVFWEKFFLNRAFDMELSYIAACALFRITAMWRARRLIRA